MSIAAAAKALSFSAKLKRRENVAEGTMAFFFERPAGFVFAAGQFIDIELQSPAETDDEGNTRTFSISSAPQDDTIMVTTRLRDTAFKRVLKTMPLEPEVKVEGPSGDLQLHEDAARAAVFLAGGIGITCQGRSKTRPLWRSKSRPLAGMELLGLRGRRGSGA
jgi:ferredoxin-NADP reductase